MEDKLFDKIKESNQLHPEYQMPEGALSSFREYTAKRDSPRRSYLAYTVLSALLLLLIGSNVFWFLRQYNTPESHRNIEPTTTTNTNNQTSKVDTIYITKYVNQNDQLEIAQGEIANYKKEYDSFQGTQEKLKSLESSLSDLKYKIANLQKSNVALTSSTDIDFRSDKSNEPSNQILISNTRKSTLDGTKSMGRLYPFEELESLESIPLSLLGESSKMLAGPYFSTITIHTKKKQTLLGFIRPKSFSIYGNFGLSIEKFEKIDHLVGRHFDIGMSTLFSNRYRARMAVGMSSNKSEFEDNFDVPDYIPGVDIPQGALLDELYVSSRFLSTTIGLDYLIKPRSIFRPYVGINYRYGRQQFVGIEYKYIFENTKLSLSADDSSILYNHLIGLSIGSDINLSNAIDAFVNLNYNQNLRGNVDSIFRLNTGFTYHF